MNTTEFDLAAIDFAALEYAARGWYVFPLKAGLKVPGCEHGLKDATTDPDVIRRWWRRAPKANIGIRTGSISGLVVLDVDPPHGFERLEALEAEHGRLPTTYTVVTARAGEHHYYRHPGGVVPNSAGKLGPGLDVRGDGGYVVAPPSVLRGGGPYQVYVAADLEPWPVPSPPIYPAPPAPPETWRPRLTVLQGGRYARAALVAEVDKVRGAPVGTRNDTLNTAAFVMGQLIGSGVLDPEPAAAALLCAALGAGLGQHEAERTIASGLRAGAQCPRGPKA